MTHSKSAQNIYKKVQTGKIKNSTGSMLFTLGKLSITLESMDIVGGVIQDWFGEWLKREKILFTKPENTQSFPDFIIGRNDYLEIKCFNYSAGPAFDIANYGAYIESLLLHPERLDASYLIFAYSMTKKIIKIEEIWMKNIWEISGPSPTNILEIQKKRGEPVNIRPKKFYSNGVKTFSTRRQFIEALHQSALKYEYPNSHNRNWLTNLESSYETIIGEKI
jgi:hypothetical protein